MPRVCAEGVRRAPANDGWEFKQLADGGATDEAIAIRGYEVERHAQREIIFDTPGDYVVEDEEVESCQVS